MTFNWSTLATLAILTATIHWIVARATITKRFWGAVWLPSWLDELLRCPACSGFWLGIGLGLAGLRPLVTGSWIANVLIAGLVGVWGTPVVEGILLWALDRTKIH